MSDDGEVLAAAWTAAVVYAAFPVLLVVVVTPWSLVDSGGASTAWAIARVCAAIAAACVVYGAAFIVALIAAGMVWGRNLVRRVARAAAATFTGLASLAGRVALVVLTLSALTIVLPPDVVPAAIPAVDVGTGLTPSDFAAVAALQLGWGAVAVSVATPFYMATALWRITEARDRLRARWLFAAGPPAAGVLAAGWLWPGMVGNVLARWGSGALPGGTVAGPSETAGQAGVVVFFAAVVLYVGIRHVWPVWRARGR